MAKYVGVSGTPPEKKPTSVFGPADTGVNIYDDEGNVITNVPYGENGIYGVGETVYKGTNSEGKEIWSANTYDFTPSITLDDVTGEIKIKAPQEFLDSDVYKQYFDDDIMVGLGRLYTQNKDTKLKMADGSEKTVKEIIDTWNEDLPNLVKTQENYARIKEGIGKKFGEEARDSFNLGTYQIMGTSAYSGRDNDYLVIPNTILNSSNWSFFKGLPGLDAETGYITKKDFDDGYYHLDAIRDLYSESPTSIARLKTTVANAIQNFSGSDMNEYAKLVAFNNFLSGEAAEGASNAPTGDLLNTVTIDAVAFYEAFARATAATAVNLTNNLGSIALAPFSLVDWVSGETEGYQPKFIIDELVGVTGEVIGDNLIPGAETVAEFLENEKNRRGDIYALTDSTANLIYNLSYMGTYTVETVLQSIAKTRLLVNGVTLGITGTSVARGIPKVTNSIQRMGMLGAKTADGAPLWTTTAREAVNANAAMVSGGVSQSVADLLTGMGNYSVWEKINLIGSLNPAELINGAFLYNQYIGQVGEDLAIIGGAGKAGAAGYEKAYAEMLTRNASLWMSQGKWGDITSTAEKIAYLKYLQPKFEAIYSAGNELLQTAAKVVTVLNGYAKYMPSVYYVSQVVIGTAMSESDSIRRLMQGTDSNEQRDILWGMIARNAIGWTIGMVVGKIIGKASRGDFDEAIESANLKTTEKIAKGVVAVRGRVDQFHMLVHGGKDWVDNISNPVKKSVVQFNQALAKSQEYIATAGDMVRAEGGTEIAARAATKAAVGQMQANQNAIDLLQHPEWQVASWHTNAYPAYNNASNVATGLANDVSKELTNLGLNVGVKPTAIVGGVALNGDWPQWAVNVAARYIQRLGPFRDDYDYSSALTEFKSNLIGTMDVASMYILQAPAFIHEREIAKGVIAKFEKEHPELVPTMKKFASAAVDMAYQHNQIVIGTGYYLKSQEEGWKKSGLWGDNNKLWFPLQRITDAQKDFEEAAKNPMKVIKSGAIRRRSTDPKHLAPGSDEMTDFVHPMISWKMHEFQTAIDLSVRNWVHVNLTNPLIKNVTKLDGSQVGAVVTYKDLKPHYEKSVVQAMNSTKEQLDNSGLVNDMLDKQKMETRLKHAKKAVADAKETWENIPNVDVKITNAARSRTIDTLPENVVDDYLDRLEVPFEGEKVDTRKWLNNKVPGFDVLNWDLLGRDHTNALYPGGLYSGLGTTAKAYIMDIDKLMALLDFPGMQDTTQRRSKLVLFDQKTNGKHKGAIIPLKRNPNFWSKDSFKFYPRGGVSFGNYAPDDVELEAYLSDLKDKGYTKVPVAISEDADMGKYLRDDNQTLMIRSLKLDAKGIANITSEIERAVASGDNPKFEVRDLAAAMKAPGENRSTLFRKIRDSIPSKAVSGSPSISDKKLGRLLTEAEEYDWGKDKDVSEKMNKSLQEVIRDSLVKDKIKGKAEEIVPKLSFSERDALAQEVVKHPENGYRRSVVLYSLPGKDTTWTQGDRRFTSDRAMAEREAKKSGQDVNDIEVVVIERPRLSTDPIELQALGSTKGRDRKGQEETMLRFGYWAALIDGDFNETVAKDLKEKTWSSSLIREIFPNGGDDGVKNSVFIVYNQDYNDIVNQSSNKMSEMYVDLHDDIDVETPDLSDQIIDISDEVSQAMLEKGAIPLYHNQNAPLGSIEFNAQPPQGDDIYTASEGIGDALWIAPNSSYTDQYGVNKVIGEIPVEYFMSDKEMKDTVANLSQELADLMLKAEELGKGALKKTYDEIEAKAPSKVLRGSGEYVDSIASKLGLRKIDTYLDMPLKSTFDLIEGKDYYVNGEDLLYEADVDSSYLGDKGPTYTVAFKPLKKMFFKPETRRRFIEEGSKKMSARDRTKMGKLESIVYPVRSSGYRRDIPKSYRALAEYTGKPVIDTTRDMMNRGISGTAFFYYKGVSPKFDKEMGRQLASQALFQNQNESISIDEMYDAMEEYDGKNVLDLLELAEKKTGLNFSKSLQYELESFEDGEISHKELSDNLEAFVEDMKTHGAPGISAAVEQALDSSYDYKLEDMNFKFWDGSGITTLSDSSAMDFLEEVGDPIIKAQEASANQLSFGDYLESLANEIPVYTDQELADIRLRDLGRKRKILKKELKELCN